MAMFPNICDENTPLTDKEKGELITFLNTASLEDLRQFCSDGYEGKFRPAKCTSICGCMRDFCKQFPDSQNGDFVRGHFENC